MKIRKAVEEYVEEQEYAPLKGQSRTTHGAHAYLRRTAAGERITHDLRLVESAVVQQAEEDGPASRMFQAAVRLGTSSELLWAYMGQSADKFRKGLKQYGWLAGAEVRAWDRYAKLRQAEDGDDVLAARVLEAYDDDSSS